MTTYDSCRASCDPTGSGTPLPASVPIDLHSHSTASDGTDSPAALVENAVKAGLGALALTDHDTVSGIAEAIAHADRLSAASSSGKSDAAGKHDAGQGNMGGAGDGASARRIPLIIPGIELSTEYNGRDIHIVGLFPDWEEASFQKRLRYFADARVYRNRKMCRLLTESGYPVDYDELLENFPDTVVARPHIAQYLLDHGLVSSISEAFKKLIGDDCPCFVPREKITPEEAVRFLLDYHGVPILAHPLQYKYSSADLEKLVKHLSEKGLCGIEVYYPSHKPSDTAQLMRLADRYELLYSGGSDYHGTRKENRLGTGYGHLFVPGTLLEPIRRCAAALRA